MSSKGSSPSSSSPRKSKDKLTPDDLHKWSKVLIKYRQFFAEIIMLILVYRIDDKMFDLLRDNLDVNIQFDPYPLNSDETFIKKDLLAIDGLEKKVNFERLGIFDEEMGSKFMRVFFGYVLSKPLDPPHPLTVKIKSIARIFMNFFANVNDINLGALILAF